MGQRSISHCVRDLQNHNKIVVVSNEVDPHLEIAEIHRRVVENNGPAILFENVKGCRFPMVSNLFGCTERARFMFRHTIEGVRRAIELKIEPEQLFKRPTRYLKAPLTAMAMRPKSKSNGPVMKNQIKLSDLPQLKSWPHDGGAFVTLPQVYSEDVRSPGIQKSNLGMYRIQISGNDYIPDEQMGLHYQIHRGIGVHHKAAMEAGKPFKVNVFVGGTPSMTLSAVMPLPEGMSELTFAGALAGHRIPMVRQRDGIHIYGDADFCIVGTVDPTRRLPEGPFGDHLGYYSLAHEFPFLNIEKVLHRDDAIWPFTVVGRPPQEDTGFGDLIHELTGPVIPTVFPGVKAVNAVDAAGVHPLLLAIGSERYEPYRKLSKPQELLTQANAILGQGQMSLAKYVMIVNHFDNPQLNISRPDHFFKHTLERVDWNRDLHFQTRTTIDTLDYSGSGFNEGSKVVIAATGSPVRELPTEVPSGIQLPPGFSEPKVCLPGILAIQGPAIPKQNVFAESSNGSSDSDRPVLSPVADYGSAISNFCNAFDRHAEINKFPLIVIVDESNFVSASLNNLVWVVFTRSNPASDIYGICEFNESKHWGCRGSLVIDCRIKPHHAPPLVEDPEIHKRVDAMAASEHPISKYL